MYVCLLDVKMHVSVHCRDRTNTYKIPFCLVGNLQLMEPEKFYYLSQSGCVSDPTINDVRDFNNVSTHMYTYIM